MKADYSAMRDAQRNASGNVVPQTAMTATNAESNGRSFRPSQKKLA
jgi:hypothetical protein